MCDRWHKLPSEVLAEDAGMLRLLQIEALAKPEDDLPGEYPREGGEGW